MELVGKLHKENINQNICPGWMSLAELINGVVGIKMSGWESIRDPRVYKEYIFTDRAETTNYFVHETLKISYLILSYLKYLKYLKF